MIKCIYLNALVSRMWEFTFRYVHQNVAHILQKNSYYTAFFFIMGKYVVIFLKKTLLFYSQYIIVIKIYLSLAIYKTWVFN